MSLVRISKPVFSRIEEEVMSLSVIYYRMWASRLQFQPIFVSFVAISDVLCHCFKAIFKP